MGRRSTHWLGYGVDTDDHAWRVQQDIDRGSEAAVWNSKIALNVELELRLHLHIMVMLYPYTIFNH